MFHSMHQQKESFFHISSCHSFPILGLKKPEQCHNEWCFRCFFTAAADPSRGVDGIFFFFQKVPGKLEEPLIANAIWGEKNTLGFWVDGHKYRYYMILLTETTTHTLKFRISKWKRNCRFRMHQ